MFFPRQKDYFEPNNFTMYRSGEWVRDSQGIQRHAGFDPLRNYGDPVLLQRVVQSPHMLDIVYGGVKNPFERFR